MPNVKIPETIKNILNDMEFIVIATANTKGNPSAVSKFILKVENSFIYLIDFVKAVTWKNIQNNPKVSLSVLDEERLISYQINGTAEILYRGSKHESYIKELTNRETSFSAKRIIEGIRRGKSHESFKVPDPGKVIVIKVKVRSIVEVGPAAEIEKA